MSNRRGQRKCRRILIFQQKGEEKRRVFLSWYSVEDESLLSNTANPEMSFYVLFFAFPFARDKKILPKILPFLLLAVVFSYRFSFVCYFPIPETAHYTFLCKCFKPSTQYLRFIFTIFFWRCCQFSQFSHVVLRCLLVFVSVFLYHIFCLLYITLHKCCVGWRVVRA